MPGQPNWEPDGRHPDTHPDSTCGSPTTTGAGSTWPEVGAPPAIARPANNTTRTTECLASRMGLTRWPRSER